MSDVRQATAVRILAALCVIYIVSHFFRVSVSVIAPDLMRELTLSSEAMGVLTGSFFITFALWQIPLGMMLDRYGARFTNAGMLLLAMAGALVFAGAESLAGLTAGRVLMGMGCAGALMGALVVCSRWFAPDRFAMVAAVLRGVGSLGNLLATAPLAAAAAAIGWRGAFVGMAVLTAGAAAVGYLVIRDAPPGHAFHRREVEGAGAVVRGIGEVIRNPAVPPMFAMNFVSLGGLVAVLGLWGGPYLHDVHGLETVARGNVLLAMALALIAGNVVFAPLDRVFDSRKRVVIAGAGASVAAFAVLALLSSPALWQVTLLFALIALFNGYNVALLAHMRSIFPDRLVGRGLTTMAVGGIGGVAVMQMTTGLIVGAFVQDTGVVSAAGYRWMFGFLAATIAAALLVYSRGADAKPSHERARRAAPVN